MSSIDNEHGKTRKDCAISADDVARAAIFPSHTHGKQSEPEANLNSHLRQVEPDSECGCDCGRMQSPSEPVDRKCRWNGDCECGEEIAEDMLYDIHNRPTNPNYKMIDPGDDSADTSKS